jgi:hypothetical protein
MGVNISDVTDGGTIIKTMVHLSDPQITILELLGSGAKNITRWSEPRNVS